MEKEIPGTGKRRRPLAGVKPVASLGGAGGSGEHHTIALISLPILPTL